MSKLLYDFDDLTVKYDYQEFTCEDCKHLADTRYLVNVLQWIQVGEFIQPNGWVLSIVCENCLDEYYL